MTAMVSQDRRPDGPRLSWGKGLVARLTARRPLPHLARWVAAVAIASILLVSRETSSGAGAGGVVDLPPLEDLVFVTEDQIYPDPGCDAISVFSIKSPTPLFQGPTDTSPHRLGGTSDLSTVLAVDHGFDVHLYGVFRHRDGQHGWRAEPDIEGPWFSAWSGIAFLADDDAFLVGVVERDPPEQGSTLHYWVSKYRVSDFQPGKLGPELGRYPIHTYTPEILVSPDGRQAHILTEDAQVHTIDAATMTSMAEPIQLQPIGTSLFPPEAFYGYLIQTDATMTADGRYLITNRFDQPEINVADLTTRQAWTVHTGNTYNGGVAINRGWINAGLLAIHAVDEVVVYRFDPPADLRELSRLAVPRPRHAMNSGISGPAPSIAWSGSGSHLIAAQEDGPTEFLVVQVEDDGRRLSSEFPVAVCQPDVDPPNYIWNLPNDIFTANGLITPPAPTPTTAPSHTPSPTATPTATATASPTPTATRRPGKLYLPLLLKEECVPGRTSVDVALVIDASTSMLEPTHRGRTKLAAAVDALRLFLLQLRLPRDQAAIVEFNSGVRLLQPLTGRRTNLNTALDRIEVRRQTRIDLGIERAHQELMSSRRLRGNEPVMIVLTDGLANPVGPAKAVENALSAKRDDIVIFTIGLGSELDMWALEEMATKPAYFYRAPTAEDLADIYAAIAVEIPCPAEAFWGRRR